MPRVDIFLPPLLGGFIFVLLWYPTRYWMRREQGYKLVFAASIAGAVFLFIATIIVNLILATPEGSRLANAWHWISPIPHSGKAAVAFGLAALAGRPLNALGRWIPHLRKDAVKDWHVRRRNDALEMFLRESMGRSQPVLVTLGNDKVYVGVVFVSITPSEPVESFQLSLHKSGYRAHETHEVTLVTHYDDVFTMLRRERIAGEVTALLEAHPDLNEDEALARVNVDDRLRDEYETDPFTVVIPMGEVRTIAPFDPAVYAEHFGPPRRDERRDQVGDRSGPA